MKNGDLFLAAAEQPDRDDDEMTLIDELIAAVDMLFEYLKYHDVEPDLLNHLNTICAIRHEMTTGESLSADEVAGDVPAGEGKWA